MAVRTGHEMQSETALWRTLRSIFRPAAVRERDNGLVASFSLGVTRMPSLQRGGGSDRGVLNDGGRSVSPNRDGQPVRAHLQITVPGAIELFRVIDSCPSGALPAQRRSDS